MSKLMVGVLALAAGAGAASADIYSGYEVGQYTIDLAGNVVQDGFSGRAVNINYDRWNAPGSSLQALYATGSREVADDLNMVGVGAGWLSHMGLSVANVNNTASNLTGGGGAIRFYRQSDGGFIGGFNFSMPALNLAAGGSVRLSFAAESLKALNIFLTDNIWVSTQFTTITWSGAGSIDNAGIQIRNPAIIGSSADGIYDVTNSQSINFGGNPLANNAYFIATDNVPTPGSLALLGLGGLVAARRRR
ncbi:MAG: hypothetical protein HRU70_09875 [Phycisphaeraceae bacterium]|nr:MAG: hypothetical protein HRU70_09875 [Phycisphaeraceae bacterium]